MREGSRGRSGRSCYFLTSSSLLFLFVPALSAVSDVSPRDDRECVLQQDAAGHPLISRIAHWEISYRRDEAGNLISKAWTHLRNRGFTFVRCFTVDAEGRKVEEMDPHGRKKRMTYNQDGSVREIWIEKEFLEESRQPSWMETLHRSLREDRPMSFEYDPSRRLK